MTLNEYLESINEESFEEYGRYKLTINKSLIENDEELNNVLRRAAKILLKYDDITESMFDSSSETFEVNLTEDCTSEDFEELKFELESRLSDYYKSFSSLKN